MASLAGAKRRASGRVALRRACEPALCRATGQSSAGGRPRITQQRTRFHQPPPDAQEPAGAGLGQLARLERMAAKRPAADPDPMDRRPLHRHRRNPGSPAQRWQPNLAQRPQCAGCTFRHCTTVIAVAGRRGVDRHRQRHQPPAAGANRRGPPARAGHAFQRAPGRPANAVECLRRRR
ncbi:hypothetical protein D3C76_570560 [compost metagenome]